jgi:hypothetical protein
MNVHVYNVITTRFIGLGIHDRNPTKLNVHLNQSVKEVRRQLDGYHVKRK